MTNESKESTDEADLVWYVTYGSNLSAKRFEVYINGGVHPNNPAREVPPCRNKTWPEEQRYITIPYSLYFAKEAPSWNKGGVAFIQLDKGKDLTYARTYLITMGQLRDIAKEENGGKAEVGPMASYVSRAQTCPERHVPILLGKQWYRELLYISELEKHPMVSLTACPALADYVKPSGKYLQTMCADLQDIHGLNPAQAAEYLLPRPGVNCNYCLDELREIVSTPLTWEKA